MNDAYSPARIRTAENKEDFDPYRMDSFGLTEEQSVEACRRLRVEGIIDSDRYDLKGRF